MEVHEDKFQLLSYPLNISYLLRQLPFYPENDEYKTPKRHVIEHTDTARDLGVLVSSNRSWSPHIEQTAQGDWKWHLGYLVLSVIALFLCYAYSL